MREKGFVHYCCYSDSLWIICGLQNWGKDIRAASVFHDLYFLNTQSILIYLVDVTTPFWDPKTCEQKQIGKNKK